GTAGTAQQVVANVATGRPPTERIQQAGLSGFIQGAIGGTLGGIRHAPEGRVSEVVPEVVPEVKPTTEPVPQPVTREDVTQPRQSVTQEDVGRRAYELYDERTKSGQPGTAADDWVQAQKELSQATEPLPAT